MYIKCKVCGINMEPPLANSKSLCSSCNGAVEYCRSMGLLNEKAFRNIEVKHKFHELKASGMKPKDALEKLSIDFKISFDLTLKIAYSSKGMRG